MIAVLVSLLAIGPQAPVDQRATVPEGTTISSVDVSGIERSRLSPGLRQDIRDLAGTSLKQQRLDELVARIEEEHPRRVAAARAIMEADDRARVVFLVSPRGEQDNVNTRYLVDRVEILGVPDEDVPEDLRKDLQGLVGRVLDSDEAERLRERLERAFPRYEFGQRITRGSQRGHIRVYYDARKRELPLWLRYDPLRADALFHSDQGWGSYSTLGIGSRDIRVTPILAIDYDDDLIEEYTGFGLRFETRRMGTRRLGASLEWSTFEPTWRSATVEALATNPSIPTLYDTRSNVTPLVKFAISPQLTLSGGVAVTELDPVVDGGVHRMANGAVGSIDYRDTLAKGDGDHEIEARFTVRSGTRALESDLVYKRYLGQGSYKYDNGRHHVIGSAMAGTISGTAPLFERFSLGDSVTLRGWDKYVVAPAGGNRMYYASAEYRYTGLAVFLDVGSVWDAPGESRSRVSTGIGLHAGPAFATIAFPLNTDHLTTVFTMGVRFSESRLRW